MKNLSRFLAYTPTIGILIFVGLFFYSSLLYPGGSQANINAMGFSWAQNYWCNLMNERGMNDQINPGKPFAILGMLILVISLMVFLFNLDSK